jgi:hypothetical protein
VFCRLGRQWACVLRGWYLASEVCRAPLSPDKGLLVICHWGAAEASRRYLERVGPGRGEEADKALRSVWVRPQEEVVVVVMVLLGHCSAALLVGRGIYYLQSRSLDLDR